MTSISFNGAIMVTSDFVLRQHADRRIEISFSTPVSPGAVLLLSDPQPHLQFTLNGRSYSGRFQLIFVELGPKARSFVLVSTGTITGAAPT
jgi:hypothetical protein